MREDDRRSIFTVEGNERERKHCQAEDEQNREITTTEFGSLFEPILLGHEANRSDRDSRN